jgi:prefoldin subunit 5
MAKKKKTNTQELHSSRVEELKQSIASLAKEYPKSYTLSQEQFDTLRKIANEIMSVRWTLEDLKGEDNISDVMFEVGAVSQIARWCEAELDEIVETFEEDDLY